MFFRDSQILINEEIQILLESSFSQSEIIQEKQLSESSKDINSVEMLDKKNISFSKINEKKTHIR